MMYPAAPMAQQVVMHPGYMQQGYSQQVMVQPQAQAPLALGMEEMSMLRQLFAQADYNRDNQLSLQEFAKVASQVGLNLGDIGAFFQKFDTDHDGRLSFGEFMAAFHPEIIASPAPAVHHPGIPGVPQDGKFVDAHFPPTRESIFKSPNPQADHIQDMLNSTHGGKVGWRRASALCPGGKLFDKIHPNDISQGVLGDCWLLAGIAGLAEFEGLIMRLFEEKSVSPDGKYNFKIYNSNVKSWETVVIDDYVPIDLTTGEPCCSKPQGNEMWVLLAEKACAKWFGSYLQLMGAYALTPFMLLTACNTTFVFSQRQLGPGHFDKNNYDAKEAFLQDCKNRNSVSMRPLGSVSSEQLWQELMAADDANHIMATFTSKDAAGGGRGASGEHIAADGIVKGHAYSLISVDTYQCDGRLWRVCHIRNPWGNNPAAEWNGELSDKWPLWGNYPELYQSLKIGSAEIDGMFWMPWEKYLDRFSDCGIARIPQNVPRLGKQEISTGIPKDGKNSKQFKKQPGLPIRPAVMQVAAPMVISSPASYPYTTTATYASAPTATYAAAPLSTSPSYAMMPPATYAAAPLSTSPSYATLPTATYAAAPMSTSPSYSTLPMATATYASAPSASYAAAPSMAYAAAPSLSYAAAPGVAYAAAPSVSYAAHPGAAYAAAPQLSYCAPVTSAYSGAPAATHSSAPAWMGAQGAWHGM